MFCLFLCPSYRNVLSDLVELFFFLQNLTLDFFLAIGGIRGNITHVCLVRGTNGNTPLIWFSLQDHVIALQALQADDACCSF